MSIKGVLILAIGLMVTSAVFAGGKKTVKTPKANFSLLEAYKQKVNPGTSKSLAFTGEHFIIVWNAATYPETFYWRGDMGFLMCTIKKAHKISKANARNYPPGMDYMTENVNGDQIHKGDTLEVTPFSGGKVRVPGEIPQAAKNTLFYKVNGNNKWQSFAVKKMSTKRAIAMQ